MPTRARVPARSQAASSSLTPRPHRNDNERDESEGNDSRRGVALSSTPPARSKRDLKGCLTCRIRRKKCPGPVGKEGDPCGRCYSRHLDCLGYPGQAPKWAGRTQQRYKECSLKSVLWLGVQMPDKDRFQLDLSKFKDSDLSLELNQEEEEQLWALEWQVYNHDLSSRNGSPPTFPRPAYCYDRLSVPQLVQHGLLVVKEFQPLGIPPEGGQEGLLLELPVTLNPPFDAFHSEGSISNLSGVGTDDSAFDSLLYDDAPEREFYIPDGNIEAYPDADIPDLFSSGLMGPSQASSSQMPSNSLPYPRIEQFHHTSSSAGPSISFSYPSHSNLLRRRNALVCDSLGIDFPQTSSNTASYYRN